MAPVRLRHIHLPASSPDGLFPSYRIAAAVQELLRRRLLDFKDAEASWSPLATPPHPTLISFTPQPTYTLGRRQAHTSSSLSPTEIARLQAPLQVRSAEPKTLRGLGVVPPSNGEEDTNSQSSSPRENDHHVFHPAVLTSPRGGLATYHGPGQVVMWPVMAINAPAARPLGYKHFSVRCYSRLLEDTTVALLRRLFGLAGFTTGDPGVWVRTSRSGEVRKISALGIHLRRHVSSLGAALNLDMPTTTAAGGGGGDEGTNPWTRFIACGLEGKGVTCVGEELRAAGGNGIPGLDAEIVARAWAEELAGRMELSPGSVEMVGRDEVDEIVATAEREGFVEEVGREEV